ncbi:ADM_collapsed_G0023440.mRNA.1.CDS.1 [Saccharomyces cerevisiae]|nr:ADM_collapsed_G0023440.mRNA.1.CDS.1 [Saccharomyces cerevisiae]
MLGTWPLLEEEKQLVYWIRQETSKGAKFSACLGRQIKELYYKVWSNLRESKTEVLQYFELGREKVPGRMGGKRRYGLCGSARESWSFSAFAFHDERLDCKGPQYVKLQFSRHHRQLRSRYE